MYCNIYIIIKNIYHYENYILLLKIYIIIKIVCSSINEQRMKKKTHCVPHVNQANSSVHPVPPWLFTSRSPSKPPRVPLPGIEEQKRLK